MVTVGSAKNIILSCLFLCIAAGSMAADQGAYDVWKGTYKYVGVGPRDLGGPVPVIEITLKIDSPSLCEITEMGFQTNGKIGCTLFSKSTGVDVQFSGVIESTSGIPAFQPKQRLFSLVGNSDESKLTTEWGALRPEFAKTSKGFYFKRVINNTKGTMPPPD